METDSSLTPANGLGLPLHASPSRMHSLPLFNDGTTSPGVSPRVSRRYTSGEALNNRASSSNDNVEDDDPPIPELPLPVTAATREPIRSRSIGSGQKLQGAGVKTASVEDEERAVGWITPVVQYRDSIDPNQANAPRTTNKGYSRARDDKTVFSIGTVGRRLEHTLQAAEEQYRKYERQSSLAAWAINIAMFSQIIFNGQSNQHSNRKVHTKQLTAIITGLSASGGGRNSQIGVAALGAIGTIVSAFLARVRGTREPERSKSHSENLEKYIRDLKAFVEDHGMSTGQEHNERIDRFRDEFSRLQTSIHQAENGQPISGNDSSPTAASSTIAPSEKSTGTKS